MTACQVAGCTQPHNARGLCGTHYQRWHRNGHTDLVGLPSDGPLVCTCPTPTPTGTDQCDRCKRVIAELIHQRRRKRQL